MPDFFLRGKTLMANGNCSLFETGRLLDTTQSVNGCFYLAGGLLLLSGLLGIPLRCLKNREKGKIAHTHPEEMAIRETLKIEEVDLDN